MTIDFIVPNSWHELTDKQLRYVFKLLATSHTADAIKTLCLLRWNGTEVVGRQPDGNVLLKRERRMFEVSPLALAELLPALNWLDKLPTIPIRLERMHRLTALPADFQGVPFETYIVVDNLYQGYLTTQKDDLLDDLAEVLYGGKPSLLQYERISVFYWIASLKDYFARRYPDFLQRATSNSNSDLLGFSQQSVEDAMNAQIRALTKGDITKEKDILAMDTWRALTELNAQAREYKELETKYNNHGK